MGYTREDIERMVEEEDVEFIRLQFADIYGNLKNMAVTASQLKKVLDNQCTFPCMAIDGFHDKDNPSLYLYPDLDTFTIFPWRPQQGRVGRFICDVYRADKVPFEGDSRQVLKNVVERAARMGYRFKVGPECEFFLFDYDEDGNPTTETGEKGCYFDVAPSDGGENARRDIVLTLEDMDFEVEASFHSEAPAQHQIDFKYDEPLAAADNITTFKLAVRTIAKRHGLYATFLPKPRNGEKGSGMHLKISIYAHESKENLLQKQGQEELTETERYFIGGLMAHMKALFLITNPIVNSYKRFVPGYDAPTQIGWSRKEYNALINLASTDYGTEKIELRSPDGAANPYLALAVCLAAGLDGLERKLEPGCQEQGDPVPGSLGMALEAFREDSYIQEVLGEYISEKYLNVKEEEWKSYTEQVTPWEIEQYLYRI